MHFFVVEAKCRVTSNYRGITDINLLSLRTGFVHIPILLCLDISFTPIFRIFGLVMSFVVCEDMYMGIRSYTITIACGAKPNTSKGQEFLYEF